MVKISLPRRGRQLLLSFLAKYLPKKKSVGLRGVKGAKVAEFDLESIE